MPGRLRALLVPGLLGLAFAAARLPFLGLGFGADADAWAVAATGRGLLSGHYVPSRLPGHPLHELIFGLLMALGGPLISNALNLALSVVALALTRDLAVRLRVTAPGATVALLACHPLFWMASVDSTDFMLATVLALAALALSLRGRAVGAGVFLGLAAATRMEMALFALPLALLAPRTRWRAVASAGLVATLAYVPVGLHYLGGPMSFADAVNARQGLEARLQTWLLSIWTGIGLVSLAVLLVLLVRSRTAIIDTIAGRDPLVRAGLALGAAYLALTLLHPGKATYFVPALPLLLLTLSRWTGAGARLVLAASLACYAFVYPDVVDRGPAGVRVGLHANNGLLAKDVVARINAAAAAAQIERARPHGAGVLVLAYWMEPWCWGPSGARQVAEAFGVPLDTVQNMAWRTPDGAVVVHTLRAEDVAALRARGVPLSYGEGAEAFEATYHGVDLTALGAARVPVRVLGDAVAESFTAPRLLACLLADPGGGACVRALRSP